MHPSFPRTLLTASFVLLLGSIANGGLPPNPTGPTDSQANTVNGPNALSSNTTGNQTTAVGLNTLAAQAQQLQTVLQQLAELKTQNKSLQAAIEQLHEHGVKTAAVSASRAP